MEQLIKLLATEALQEAATPEALKIVSDIFGTLAGHFQHAATTHPDAH